MKQHFKNLIALLFISGTMVSSAQTVNSWLTKGDKSVLLQQQANTTFTSNTSASVTINENTTYQTIDGYGFCFTEGSAEAISTLNTTTQNQVLNEFYNPTTGIGNEIIRISIGASDLSSSSYSYSDGGANSFSLAGPDLTYLIPMLKRALAINPNIKILATPWSAPRWMKSNNGWIGGTLKGEFYQAYAEYFVKYLNAMRNEGIEIWAITPQNEPENGHNEPSMEMDQEAQLWFINAHLGPTMRNAGFNTKIIAFDHNLDNTNYPTRVAGNSDYVDGSAFHLYAGNISAMTTVKNATNKNIYFTEQYTGTNGSFSGDFGWHMQNVMIGSMNNWAKIALEWNLATNSNYGPRTPGGCTECLGAITVANNNITRNVSYYIIAQFSKFVKSGAVRIGSSTTEGDLHQVAFKNTDGSIAVVLYNNGGNKTITIGNGTKSFSSYIPGYSAITYTWNSISATTGLVTAYKDCNYSGFSGGLQTGDYNRNQLASLGILDNDISSLKVMEGFKAIIYQDDNFQGASKTITSNTSCLDATWNDKVSSVRILPNGDPTLSGLYYLQNKESDLFMDVRGSTDAVEDGANIQQWYQNLQTNQQFLFTHLGDGTYKVTAAHSNKTLDVEGMKTTNGANIQQWTYYGSENQHFIAFPMGNNYYKLIPKHSGKVIEIAACSKTPEANVQQWNNDNQSCSHWKLIPALITNTEDLLESKALNIFPNPSKNTITLEGLPNNMLDITIYNTLGETALKASNSTINISSLPTGVYLLKVKMNDQMVVKRFVKE